MEPMKILQSHPEGGKVMTQDGINLFLQNTLNLHLATIDEKGEPNIQPLWFIHDQENQKIYFSTYKNSKKIKNMEKNSIVYFAIDENKSPYRCVKGKADISISENIPIVEKICLKYIGSLDAPYSKTLIDIAKNGGSVIVEIMPRFYSTWDFSS